MFPNTGGSSSAPVMESPGHWSTTGQLDTALGNSSQWPLTGLARQEAEWSERVATVIAYSFFAGIGVFTNSFPILLTFFTRLKKNQVNIMVANMSSADFLECFIAVCGQNLYILYRESLPPVGCKIIGYAQFVMTVQTFLFPPCLSVNRYISLFHGHLYDRWFTTRNIYLIILLTWVLSNIIPLMFLLGGQNRFDEDNIHCCIVTQGNTVWTAVYWLSIIIPLMGCCNGTMTYCNIRIFQHLRDHASDQKIDMNVVKQHREMLYLMVMDMMMPIATHTVYHVTKFAYYGRQILFFKRFFTCLMLLNSALRGVITMTLLGPYRKQTKKVLTFEKWRNKDRVVPFNSSMASKAAIGPRMSY